MREYRIIDPARQFRIKMDISGVLSSEVVPGFEIPVRAIFDEQENLALLRRLLAGS